MQSYSQQSDLSLEQFKCERRTYEYAGCRAFMQTVGQNSAL